MSYIVDAVDVFSPLFIIQVLPLATDNLNWILREKKSAGRAVGIDQRWTAMSEYLKRTVHYQRPPHPFLVSGKGKNKVLFPGCQLLTP